MPNHSRQTTGARPKRPPYASPNLFSGYCRASVRYAGQHMIRGRRTHSEEVIHKSETSEVEAPTV